MSIGVTGLEFGGIAHNIEHNFTPSILTHSFFL